MSIGATLLGQMITFALFVLFTMKFVWPPLVRALHERQSRIAAGIAAGERGQNELEQAEVLIKQKLQEGRLHASQIIDEATKRANAMIDEAKVQARQEAARILAKAESEVEQMVHDLRETLRKEVSGLAMSGAQKILSRSVNSDVQKAILDRMIEEV